MKVRISILPYLVVIATFLLLLIGFDFNGLYGQDAHEYLRHGRALREYFDHGTPFRVFHWPHTFSAFGALLSYSGLSVAFCLQLVALTATLFSLFVAQKIIRLLYQTDGSWFLLLGAATQVYFIRSGYLVMSDALCGVFVISCIYFTLKLQKERRVASFIWVVLFAIAAMYTRYASFPILLVVVLYACYLITSNWSKVSQVLIVGIVAVVGALLLWWNNMALVKINSIIDEWSISNFFTVSRFDGARTETNTVPNIVYIFSNFAHIGYLSMGAVLLIWIKKWNWNQRFLWVSLLVYCLFLGGLMAQNQRFLVISHLIVLVLLFPGFQELQGWLQKRKLWAAFIVGVIVFNGMFFYYSFSKLYAMHLLEKEIVAELETLEDSKIIYTFYLDNSFGTYELPNPTEGMWQDSLHVVPDNYVVFNPSMFESSWKGSPVMNNWERMNKEYDLELMKNLPKNWRLYRIK